MTTDSSLDMHTIRNPACYVREMYEPELVKAVFKPVVLKMWFPGC